MMKVNANQKKIHRNIRKSIKTNDFDDKNPHNNDFRNNDVHKNNFHKK